MTKQFQSYEALPQLLDATANAALYIGLTSAAQVTDIAADAQCKMLPGYRLINVSDPIHSTQNRIEIALINDIRCSVIYYNKVLITSLPTRIAARSYVWRSASAEHAVMLREVFYKVFFHYLIKKYKLVISDSHRNGEGRFDWHRKMSYAIGYGLNVYYFHPKTSRLQAIQTQESLSSLIDQLWTSTEDKQEHLAIISKDPIPQNLFEIAIEQ